MSQKLKNVKEAIQHIEKILNKRNINYRQQQTHRSFGGVTFYSAPFDKEKHTYSKHITVRKLDKHQVTGTGDDSYVVSSEVVRYVNMKELTEEGLEKFVEGVVNA